MGKPGPKATRLTVGGQASTHAASIGRLDEGFRDPEQSEPEGLYRSSVSQEHRKRLGQFFTPAPIAELMAEWIQAIHPRTILDPAVGPGIFPRVLRTKCPDATITCLDLDGVALHAARLALGDWPQIEFVHHDFLTWTDDRVFDAAIANPPYLRHHDLSYAFDVFHFIGKKNHVGLSRLSNIYVLFILEMCRRLRPGGRAAVIVPGEWVNANFGDTLKSWLVGRGVLRTLLYFSHASSQFDDALTTASILFLEKAEGAPNRRSIRTVFVQDGSSLDAVRRGLRGKASDSSGIVAHDFSPDELLAEKKWNHLLSHGKVDAAPGFVPLSELAETHRGIATGCNSFFHLTRLEAARLQIRDRNLTPCVGRAADVMGLRFTEADFEALVERGARTHLLDMRSAPSKRESAYISQGEADGLHERYLCAARGANWYAMERTRPAPVWVGVFARHGLRFIHNEALVSHLTTFHGIYPRTDSPAFAAALAACLNSEVVLSLAQRQHRVYGGGLFKVEPKDLLDMDVPDLRKASKRSLSVLSGLLRKLDRAARAGRDDSGIRDELDAAVRGLAKEAAAVQQ